MLNIFFLQNNDGSYLARNGEWQDGSDSKLLYRTPHKDEAINQKVECTVKNPTLRISVIGGISDHKGHIRYDENTALTIAATQKQSAAQQTQPLEHTGNGTDLFAAVSSHTDTDKLATNVNPDTLTTIATQSDSERPATTSEGVA